MGAETLCRTASPIGSAIEAVDDKVRCHKDADFFRTLGSQTGRAAVPQGHDGHKQRAEVETTVESRPSKTRRVGQPAETRILLIAQ